MNNRRKLVIALGAGAFVTPTASFAQKPPARIAWLGASTSSGFRFLLDEFKLGLSDNRLAEGKDYVIDERWAEGRYDRLPALAYELMQRKPAAIIVGTAAAVQAAQQATQTVPIIMAAISDPVGVGFVKSLARPGGNITGTSNLVEDTLPKLLETLQAVIPKAVRVLVMLNPENSVNLQQLNVARAAAGGLGLTVQAIELRSPNDLDAVFSALPQNRTDPMIILADAMLLGVRERVSALMLKRAIPTIAYQPEYVDAGALISYGASRRHIYRYTASYVKKILDGAKPADLPVEQPSRIELWVNLKTAKSLGITVPQSILVRADKVIE